MSFMLQNLKLKEEGEKGVRLTWGVSSLMENARE